MSKDYRRLIQEIENRQNPDRLSISKSLREELSSIAYSDVLVFIKKSMNEVNPDYTRKSREAGERVKEHLMKQLNNVDYRYQGSVMTNTHIRGYSDIDLLTICNRFYSYDSRSVKIVLDDSKLKGMLNESQVNKLIYENKVRPYDGNVLQDLFELRIDSENILSNIYSRCDISHPKAIKIENLDLHREVDIVIANWHDDITSIINDKRDYRGIQIYDKHNNSRGPSDYPFLSINRINTRSSNTQGRLKKMIRFLKNVKAQCEKDIVLSSFDINAICYDLSETIYEISRFDELVPILCDHLNNIYFDSNYSDNLKSVDGKEFIFKNNSDKLSHLKLLLDEITLINNDLKKVIT